MDKEDKQDIKLVKSSKDSSEAFQAPEQSLNLIALFIHLLIVLPGIQTIAFGWNNRCHSKIKNPLARLIAFVGSVHNHLNAFQTTVLKPFEQFAPLRRITGLARRQRKRYGAVVTGCNHVNLSAPSCSRLADRLSTVFFKAPAPSG